MFKRRWRWFGQLISEEGFSLRYGHKSIYYIDERGRFEFGLEDGFLFPTAFQIAGTPVQLSPSEVEVMTDRVIRGIRAEGHTVELYKK